MFKVKTTVDVPDDVVKDTLVSALEGGSNYWYTIVRHEKGDTKFLSEAPFNGGWLEVDDKKIGNGYILKKPYRVDMESIKAGLEIVGRDYPKHFADLAGDDGDATTADVFLQCIVLGEVIYG